MFASCSNARYLTEGQYYYKGTEVNITDSANLPASLEGLQDDLADLSKMEPNKKLLGVYPLKLWFYNVGDTGIDMYIRNRAELEKRFLFFDFEKLVNNLNILEPKSKFRNWLTNKAGEAPGLMDSALVIDTKVRMQNYLYNRGYFTPEVGFEIDYVSHERTRRATVEYEVNLNTLYRMRTITYEIEDPEMKRIINLIPDTSYLQPGNPFDVDYIKNERTRIANFLLTYGYYGFEKDYVYFEADTASGIDSLDIFVKIAKPLKDSIHRRYRINRVFVYPNAKLDLNSGLPTDTLRYNDGKSDYYIIGSNIRYKPKSLADNIFINDSSTIYDDGAYKVQLRYYDIEDFRQTIASFSNLGIFKYVSYNINVADTGNYFRYMDVIIKLEPLPGKTFSYEFNTDITTDKLLGTSLNLTFIQKNLLRRLDQLRLNIYGGIESQVTGGAVFINTSEFSTSLDLILPRRFWPIPNKASKKSFPKTIISVKGSYSNRLDFYELFNTNFLYNWQWLENTKSKQWAIAPVNINIVSILDTTTTFNEILQDNLLLLQSFQEQLIFAPGVSFIYNSQLRQDKRNDFYFKGSLEVAGMIYHALSHWGEFSKEDTITRTIGNLPYSNFTRIDFDVRDYFEINNSNNLAFRFLASISVPYWNSEVNPYVKQFYAGGANDIRAFPIRKLGPGGYFPFYENYEDSIVEVIPGDQNGDIKLGLNAEYRFDLFSIFEGALFCDIGNIWTLKPDPARPFSNFEFSDFYNELAIGPGAGLRLDFEYVIVRLDAAYPLKDPALDSKNGQERIQQIIDNGLVPPEKKVVWSLAFAYPF
ncbi:MAG: BamA/TamA family outer membrane protein [Chitinophagales bacterium]